MQTFILGYEEEETKVTDNGENLTVYTTKEEASFKSVEWMAIDAESESEARLMFESQFVAWQENNRQLI